MTKCAAAALGLWLLVAALLPSAGVADFGIKPGSVKIEALDSSGNPDTRAGSHPDRLVVDFEFTAAGTGTGARDLLFEFSPGLTGSPIAAKTCPRAVFELEECPTDTEVGKFLGEYVGGESFNEPVYNLVPAPNQLAVLGFHPFWLSELELKLRPGDYGLDISALDMPHLPFEEGHFELWGVPADHNGSPERTPFLTLPTECGPMKLTLGTRSWDVGAPWLTETAEGEPIGGCESLPFEPSLGLHLGDSRQDSPTGAEIDLKLAESDDPSGTAAASMKSVHIDFPSGLTLSPAGVAGRETCADSQFGLHTGGEVVCPPRSRVGSVQFSTPELGEDLFGSMFLGREQPGERFRLFVHAAARGIDFKALVNLVADRRTGQLSAELSDLPQFAVSEISMNFEGGSHSLLATPISCGFVTAGGRFAPSGGGAPVESATSLGIGLPCAGQPPFAPTTVAGSNDLGAGRSTGFSLTLTRQQGEQLPKKYSVTLPPGLSANLTAVDLCPSSAAAGGSCSADSKIGTAVAEVGSGPNPETLHGTVYLTAGYQGAPFGLSVVFRAAIGPFDLGTLNVQATLALDPRTGQVVLGHLLPSIFEGVPVRFRMLGLDFPRGDFLVNPTSCEPEYLAVTATSVDGRAATQSVPFEVGGCDKLAFRPKFSAAFSRVGGHGKRQELSFSVRMPKGDMNLKRFSVTFPRGIEFHNSAVQEVCARGDALEGRCRAASRVGTGTAYTPLLKGPLRGPVYLVQPEREKGLPDLWSEVEGMGVKLRLMSESHRRGGRLSTELFNIPDLPLSSFTMRLDGGFRSHSLFSLSRRACDRQLETPVELEGQGGDDRTTAVRLKAGCGNSRARMRAAWRPPRKR